MADTAAASNILNGDLRNILDLLSAAAGLGTAAMGLVDASKAIAGGPSNFGFCYIKTAVAPFLPTPAEGTTAFGRAQTLQTLRANWLNGVAMADQKATAKSLIHLGLTPSDAAKLARAAGVDPNKLTSLARKIASGAKADPDEINVLGRFDAILSAVLDACYERADQKYRNLCKLLAMGTATILAVIGGRLVNGDGWGYFASWYFVLSLIVGLASTPLAPIAKDLASSLQAAVTAAQTARPLRRR